LIKKVKQLLLPQVPDSTQRVDQEWCYSSLQVPWGVSSHRAFYVTGMGVNVVLFVSKSEVTKFTGACGWKAVRAIRFSENESIITCNGKAAPRERSSTAATRRGSTMRRSTIRHTA
jgi:hypothetical protein